MFEFAAIYGVGSLLWKAVSAVNKAGELGTVPGGIAEAASDRTLMAGVAGAQYAFTCFRRNLQRHDVRKNHILLRAMHTGRTPKGDGGGVFDLTGNVWEWTSSEFKAYPYKAADGREDAEQPGEVRRVARGGSWNLNRHYARASVRFVGHPDGRDGSLGFRVVCVSPIR
jgi:formylglycine-generating enzyme required for sulfatase activity